ncbi:MAG TPA: glycosyltransferase [Ruminococcaceae bacterium]|nr:glycosyltransferase [Oscillospiraceae bacterium]
MGKDCGFYKEEKGSINLLLSIIVPCYNEAPVLDLFFNRTSAVTKQLQCDCEFIFVDDGSADDTLPIMKRLASENQNVFYYSFSRNFGKEAALLAGLENCKGDLVVVMDADLQDPPELLPKMVQAIEEEGYDSVGTRRVTRAGEPPIRSFFAHQFYKLIRRTSKVDIVDGARDYRMMTRTMVNAIISMQERQRFSKGIFGWVGFHSKWIEFENEPRAAGETKWSFWKLFTYALDGLINFSTAPLRVASVVGFVISICSFIYLLIIIFKTLILGIDTPGYASMIVTVLLLGGIQLIAIGILGEYLSRNYLETKHRPVYIVREQNLPEKTSD